jgi:hypothetical protein
MGCDGESSPAGRGAIYLFFCIVSLFLLLGGLVPRDLRTAHRRAEGGSLLSEYTDRGPDTGSLSSCLLYFPYATYPLGMHGVSREINKNKIKRGVVR